MNITTKAQHLIKLLGEAEAAVTKATKIMGDADISTAMWAEISGIQNNLWAVLGVLEDAENDSE